MTLKTLGAAALLLILAAPALAASPDQAAPIARVEQGLTPAVIVKGRPVPQRSLDERMRHYKVPGVSIAVIDKGRIAWAKGYGVMGAGAPEPVTIETRFQAGSISKPVAVAGALSLAVDGRLNVDEPVNARLKGWQVPASDRAPGYSPSLRALASHSAGLGVHGFDGYEAGKPIPTLLEILDGQPPANSPAVRIDGAPGTWRYSGGGTTILQKLVMDVTGQAFPDVMKTRVLGPVGMTHSSYGLARDDERLVALGHLIDGSQIPGRWRVHPELAAAGLWATPSDLAAFAIAVARARHGDGSGGIDPRVAALMLEPQAGLDTGGRGRMGLGFFLNKPGEVEGFNHGGSTEGYKCMLIMHSETGQGVVVMTNAEAGAALMSELIRSIAAAYGWPDYAPREIALVSPDPATQARVAGTYSIEDAPLTVTLTVAEGRMHVRYWDGRETILQAESARRYVDMDDGTTFDLGAEDGVLTVRPGGREGPGIVIRRKS